MLRIPHRGHIPYRGSYLSTRVDKAAPERRTCVPRHNWCVELIYGVIDACTNKNVNRPAYEGRSCVSCHEYCVTKRGCNSKCNITMVIQDIMFRQLLDKNIYTLDVAYHPFIM